MSYKIVRMFFEDSSQNCTPLGGRGLTLEEAQAWCRDPETSSSTCEGATGKGLTEKYGPWFDGYEEERS